MWGVAKLVRHQTLDLAFVGSNPTAPANYVTSRSDMRYAVWFVALLSALSAICAGCWYVKPQDQESMDFVKSTVLAVASSWRPAELYSPSSPELIKALPRQKMNRLCSLSENYLGRLRTYHGARGSTRFLLPPQNGATEVAEYVVTATFAKGEGQIAIGGIKRSHGWLVTEFYVRKDF